MKPSATYTGRPALGLRGKKKGMPLDCSFIMELQGVPFRPLEALDERRGGVRVFEINAHGQPTARSGTHILGTRQERFLSGLFPLGSDYPGCYVGGWPKPEEGDKKDFHALLVKRTPGRLVVYVFLNVGRDKKALAQDWKEGNLDGVEPPK